MTPPLSVRVLCAAVITACVLFLIFYSGIR